MFIVDSQVHIWAASSPERPWPSGKKPPFGQPPKYSKNTLLQEMDAAGVAGVVLVPPMFEGGRNDLVLEASRLHPTRFAVMGKLSADQPENISLMASWKRQPGMMGIRTTITSSQQKAMYTQGKADWFWREAERTELPLMLNFATDLIPEIGKIAERHPGLRLAVDHLGLPITTKDEATFAFLPQVLALAKWPNVVVKVSALPCYTSEQYPFSNVHKYMRQVYDAFGPQRMFWGSDLTRLPCPYRQAITLFTEELPWLTAADQEWIMGRALCEWLDWPLPEA